MTALEGCQAEISGFRGAISVSLTTLRNQGLNVGQRHASFLLLFLRSPGYPAVVEMIIIIPSSGGQRSTSIMHKAKMCIKSDRKKLKRCIEINLIKL